MDFTGLIIGYIISGFVIGGISGTLAEKKGYSAVPSFCLGFFFSIIGLLYAVGLPIERTRQVDMIREALCISKEEIEKHNIDNPKKEESLKSSFISILKV